MGGLVAAVYEVDGFHPLWLWRELLRTVPEVLLLATRRPPELSDEHQSAAVVNRAAASASDTLQFGASCPGFRNRASDG